MSLLLAHPELPPCDDCVRWVHDPETWRRLERPRGTPVPRAGGRTPCHRCPKVPRGEEASPATGRLAELSDANRRVYEHYLKCRATLRFPEDPIVERHAMLLLQVERHHERAAGDALPLALAFAGLFARQK